MAHEMSGADLSFGPEVDTLPLQMTVIDFGPGNSGAFGPREDTLADPQAFISEVANRGYNKPPSSRWRCVDGRGPADEAASNSAEADSQIAGSLPIANTAADMMDGSLPDDEVVESKLIAKNTEQAVASGEEVIVHGDDHGYQRNLAGCVANRDKREVLRANGRNIDIVAPRAWAIAQAVGLDRWVTEDDVIGLIQTGARRAENDAHFDITPERAIEIAVENGARYQELTGPHQEEAVVATTDETCYDTRAFARDHQVPDGGERQLFGATFGRYAGATMRIAMEHGDTQDEAARKVLGGIIFTIGVCKKVGNKSLPGMLVS